MKRIMQKSDTRIAASGMDDLDNLLVFEIFGRLWYTQMYIPKKEGFVMYELVQVGEKSYYVNCPAKIGIYLANDSQVYLIDSGNDKDAGKKVRKILDEQGWSLKGIINTHSHADHIGGNRYLQQQTGCKIFASGIEAAFTNAPVLEPVSLYGGYPNKDLRHKFLMAQESVAVDITDKDFPKELEVIPLPGHSFEMIGIRTPDDVVFLADAVSSESTLEKYRISFIYDVAQYLDTLDRVERLEAAMFVPAHAEAVPDIKALVVENRQTVWEIAEDIQRILQAPMCFEELLRQIFTEYGLTMTMEQHALVGSTVRSYLSWMKDSGKLQTEIVDNQLLWSSI